MPDPPSNPGPVTGPLPRDGLRESDEIDVELSTSKSSNQFVPGEKMVIYVTNQSKRPVYIELIVTSTMGRKAILTSSPQMIAAGGQFRFPEAGKTLEADVNPGKEQITVYAGASPFPAGALVRAPGEDDRIVRSFDGAGSSVKPPQLVSRTIVIETRPAPARRSGTATRSAAEDSTRPPGR